MNEIMFDQVGSNSEYLPRFVLDNMYTIFP